MIKINKNKWHISENLVTSEKKYLNRRNLIKGAIGYGVINSFLSTKSQSKNISSLNDSISNYGKVVKRNSTPFSILTKYNNFYEFGTSKQVWKAARKLKTNPWKITCHGEINKSLEIDVRDLIKKVSIEERIYRFRCVEAWSMVVPWMGFELSSLIKILEPNTKAKYVVFETFYNPEVAKGQKQDWYPWPYKEIITLDEAMNKLSFIATGIYGQELPSQNGAPLRLVVPWKYGFKSIKSIVSISLVSKRPKSFWETVAPKEYGFWANINPNFPHPRWSQETEKDIETGKRIPSLLYNGYDEWVSHMYDDINDKNFFF